MEKLWRIIEKEKIEISYCNLREGKKSLFGLYLYDYIIGPTILLDRSLEHMRRLHRCVLAEEIGHYYTAPRTNYLVAYTCFHSQITMSQDERKALQFATNLLIPNEELNKALKSGYYSCFELAEYFDVTEWFMHRKLEFLKICSHKTR